MIKGYATIEKTSAFAKAHQPLAYAALGATQLMASQAGFGCYRVSIGVARHEQALRKALLAGINLIDTSANYGDGGSEQLIGKVLQDLIDADKLQREHIIVVSKAGYLQGQNHALSQQRKLQGRPFQEIVTYDEGLEHCIHPEFLQDQLERSLERLGLKTLDFYLLHNPEYYLDRSHTDRMDLDAARTEYYRRIRHAFAYLEQEVARGRIRHYGISSNTFPAPATDADFTCLDTVWRLAEDISAKHHFRLIQLPFNLLETGAVLARNQPHGQSTLQLARDKGLGVVVNRPLNAFAQNRLIRLADIEAAERHSDEDIIGGIRAVARSEKKLWRRLLPELSLPPGLVARIKEQIAVGDNLKHYWRNFGSYERWRQVKTSFYVPRVQGVMNFLEQHAPNAPDSQAWIQSHWQRLEEAFAAVESVYAEAAARDIKHLRQLVNAVDSDWAQGRTLSQKALRALRSTPGIATVLVGMRRERYVDDVLAELQRPVPPKERTGAWEELARQTPAVLS